LVLVVLAVVVFVCLGQKVNQPKSSENSFIHLNQTNMKIESPVFGNNEPMPVKYTCKGENVNPPLKISEVPASTKSLALIIDDPDAPAGHWSHWVLWNINPQTTEITENSVPVDAIEGLTNFGKPGYDGPCPPSGTHRYFFYLFALDTTLNLDSRTQARDLEQAMQGHILAEAQLIGLVKH
jgi:Raf kinase inhibitor-like YbhB/YbcL family protein